jgi:hypothetical protein
MPKFECAIAQDQVCASVNSPLAEAQSLFQTSRLRSKSISMLLLLCCHTGCSIHENWSFRNGDGRQHNRLEVS